MKAADVMARAVVTVHPGARILDAIRLMLDQRISGLPVIDSGGELVGILTEGDLLRRAETGTEKHRPQWLEFLRGPGKQAEDYVHTHGRRVEEIMTREVATVGEDAPLDEVVRLMEKKRIRRVPVVTSHKLAGIVSRADLLRALFKLLDQDAPAPTGDAALRVQVIEELRRQNWGGRSRVSVVVTDGVVYLEGFIYDLREREAMRVAAENVSGVKEVRDHIDYLDPSTVVLYGL